MLKEDYVIIIKGHQTIFTPNGDTIEDENEINTLGSYTKKHSGYYISYQDMKEDEQKPPLSIIKVSPEFVSMQKGYGKYKTELKMEVGKKNFCAYQTPYGALTMAIHTSKIENNLSEDGGELYLEYNIYFDAQPASQNTVRVSVKKFEN